MVRTGEEVGLARLPDGNIMFFVWETARETAYRPLVESPEALDSIPRDPMRHLPCNEGTFKRVAVEVWVAGKGWWASACSSCLLLKEPIMPPDRYFVVAPVWADGVRTCNEL